MRHPAVLVLMTGALLLWACGIDRAGLASLDAGPSRRDGGPSRTDAGPGDRDAGPGDRDAGCVAESCNGEDDDCDRRVDEALLRSCGVSVGECVAGVEVCTAGAWSECTGEIAPGIEVCDGSLDEDCDGSVDEGCVCTPGATMPCGEDEGVCTPGIQSCGVDGSWEPCAGAIGPSAELCDAARLDEDCDGTSNEECACDEGDTRSCTAGGCTGTETCDLMGAWGGCTPDVGTETCNGEDDDCDGTVDEGPAVCECDVLRRGGNAYLLCHASPQAWADARGACAARGYHLAVIDGMGEQMYLRGQTSAVSLGSWWIGLRDLDGDGSYEDGEWDGGRSAYRRWLPGRPNDAAGCAMMVNGFGGRWEDDDCSNDRAYVCESP